LSEVDALVVVGWRGRESHFLQDLQNRVKRVPTMVIGGNDAQEVVAALRKIEVSGPGLGEPNGFTHVMRGPDLEKFLSYPPNIWPL
jgi:hypothetical protein